MDIIASCRSVEIILSLLPYFTVKNDSNEQGLFCKTCEVTLKYDFKLGVTFKPAQNLPASFSHLKESVKRHVQSSNHIATAATKKKQLAEQTRLLKQSKEAAINCASAAYFVFKLGMSYISYEHIVTEIYSSGGHVGLKNHSKEFPRKFLPHMYDVLRGSVVSFVTGNKLPFGLLADKMTAKHRKRHIMGIRVPVWDINNPVINRDIYIRHSAVGYGSGLSIVDHLLKNLNSFGIETSYVRKHLIGMAMDGQYTCLNVGTHMSDKLQRDINLSWDPMHRVELASNDSSSLVGSKVIISDTISTIQETMIKFKVGNNFEILFSEKELCDTFYTPKVFKDMKFVTYSSEVFKTFINDFKAIISACDKIKDEDGTKKKILNSRFLLNMLFLADVNCFLAMFSKKVQKSSNLPWEYSNSLDYMMGQIEFMLDQILMIQKKMEHDFSFEDLLTDLSKDLFPFFKSSVQILSNNEYQGITLLRDHLLDGMLRRGNEPPPSTPTRLLKKLVSFGIQYLAALRDNFNARFDCQTIRVCRKFKLIFDPTPYLYPRTDHLIDDPLCDFTSFESFFNEMPFFISKTDEFKRTLYFQLLETRKVVFGLISSIRDKGLDEQINVSSFLKLLYSKLDAADSMAEVKYFMSSVIAFPVSEAIVESWGSVIDKVIGDKIAFKESVDIDTADITEEFVFIKLVGPSVGATSNRKLFKRALTLMYNGTDYANHFMAPHGKGFTSTVIEKRTSGDANNSFFS